MPRYFFDTDDGDRSVQDDDGLELPDHEAARRLAQATLLSLADDKLPDGDRRDFTIHIRDASGTTIYSARLALDGEWHQTGGLSAKA